MRVRAEASSAKERQGRGHVSADQDLRVEDQGQRLQATSGCQGQAPGCCARSQGVVGRGRDHELAEVRKDESGGQSEHGDEELTRQAQGARGNRGASRACQVSRSRHEPRETREGGGPSGILTLFDVIFGWFVKWVGFFVVPSRTTFQGRAGNARSASTATKAMFLTLRFGLASGHFPDLLLFVFLVSCNSQDPVNGRLAALPDSRVRWRHTASERNSAAYGGRHREHFSRTWRWPDA